MLEIRQPVSLSENDNPFPGYENRGPRGVGRIQAGQKAVDTARGILFVHETKDRARQKGDDQKANQQPVVDPADGVRHISFPPSERFVFPA